MSFWRCGCRPSGPLTQPAWKDFMALMISSSDTLEQFDWAGAGGIREELKSPGVERSASIGAQYSWH